MITSQYDLIVQALSSGQVLQGKQLHTKEQVKQMVTVCLDIQEKEKQKEFLARDIDKHTQYVFSILHGDRSQSSVIVIPPVIYPSFGMATCYIQEALNKCYLHTLNLLHKLRADGFIQITANSSSTSYWWKLTSKGKEFVKSLM